MQDNFTKEEKWLLMRLKMAYFHWLNNLHQTWVIRKKMKIDLSQPSPEESHISSSLLQHEEKAKSILSELNRQVVEKNKIINKELLKEYFRFQDLISMQIELYKTKNTGKKNKLVNVIKSGLRDFKEEIKDMGEEEKEIEQPNEIVDIVEKTLDFNKQNQRGKV